MRTYIDDIMHDRRGGLATLPARFILRFMSVLYGMYTALRNYLYDTGRLTAHDVPCRVVCIGNLTLGGTGKTPAVIMSARMLADAGFGVAVVSRGYGRTGGDVRVVADGDSILAGPAEAGDEPHIIATSLPGVPVVVGADRHAAAKLACGRFRPDVILLDDGFQHRRLYRQADIVTVDADDPFGNEMLLPRGVLRESPYALNRAKAVLLTRCRDDHRMESIERMIRYYDRDIPVFPCRYGPSGLRRTGEQDIVPADALNGTAVAALSNIASPGQFHRMLTALGADVVVSRAAPDHHRHTVQELDDFVRDARGSGAENIVMTAKDERDMPAGYRFETIDAWVLDIEAVIDGREDEYLAVIAPKGRGNPKGV